MPRGWLLDTNVLSETLRTAPDARVMAWLEAADQDKFHVSVLTIGELRKGVLMAAAGRRRERLAQWLDQTLPEWFEDRVLPIDTAVCARWAQLLADARRPLPAIDSLLAATALRHDLSIVTRNVADFEVAGLAVVDPWSTTR